ncbi:hypothetical protein PWR66_03705 [Paraburkholderia sp. A1RO-5]|uniref:hypothetical protein n=1 Tax=Paraburkholderia sp. A1RO-5 TaxID=3028369 RepID=UPI003B7D0F6D
MISGLWAERFARCARAADFHGVTIQPKRHAHRRRPAQKFVQRSQIVLRIVIGHERCRSKHFTLATRYSATGHI